MNWIFLFSFSFSIHSKHEWPPQHKEWPFTILRAQFCMQKSKTICRSPKYVILHMLWLWRTSWVCIPAFMLSVDGYWRLFFSVFQFCICPDQLVGTSTNHTDPEVNNYISFQWPEVSATLRVYVLYLYGYETWRFKDHSSQIYILPYMTRSTFCNLYYMKPNKLNEIVSSYHAPLLQSHHST